MDEQRHDSGTRTIVGWIIFPICVVVAAFLIFPVVTLLNLFSIDGNIISIIALLLWGGSAFVLTDWANEKIYILANKKRTRHRDASADRLTRNVLDGMVSEPYILYLRSFSIDKFGFTWYTGEGLGLTPDLYMTSFDDELAYATEAKGFILLAVGDRGSDRVGAARFATTDSDWERVVHKLMSSASAIVVCPDYTASVMREIEYIFRNVDVARKTVLVMLPHIFEQPWNRLRKHFKESGIPFPEYCSSGASFNLNGVVVEFPLRFHNRTEFLDKVFMALPAA